MGFTRWQWYYNKTQHTKIHISHKIIQLAADTPERCPNVTSHVRLRSFIKRNCPMKQVTAISKVIHSLWDNRFRLCRPIQHLAAYPVSIQSVRATIYPGIKPARDCSWSLMAEVWNFKWLIFMRQ
jgi:hypothetical protein